VARDGDGGGWLNAVRIAKISLERLAGVSRRVAPRRSCTVIALARSGGVSRRVAPTRSC